MRLIDADALHKAYMELRNFKQDTQSGDWISLRAVPLTTVIRMLKEAPTIEPKRGEWKLFYESKDGNNVYQCSCCRFIIVIPEGIKLFSFCPNCGADMREREGE